MILLADTVKVLLLLRRCAGWSGPSLSAYFRRPFFRKAWPKSLLSSICDSIDYLEKILILILIIFPIFHYPSLLLELSQFHLVHCLFLNDHRNPTPGCIQIKYSPALWGWIADIILSTFNGTYRIIYLSSVKLQRLGRRWLVYRG